MDCEQREAEDSCAHAYLNGDAKQRSDYKRRDQRHLKKRNYRKAFLPKRESARLGALTVYVTRARGRHQHTAYYKQLET